MAALGLALADLLASLGVGPGGRGSATAWASSWRRAPPGCSPPRRARLRRRPRPDAWRDFSLADAGAMRRCGRPQRRSSRSWRRSPGSCSRTSTIRRRSWRRARPRASTRAGGHAQGGAGPQVDAGSTVSHAFHSPLMAGATEPLARRVSERRDQGAALRRGELHRAARPYAVDTARKTFVAHATAPVNFIGGVEACAALGARVWVQVGAGSALLTMARGTLAARGGRPAALVSLAQTDADDTSKLCEALVELAVLGVPLSLSSLLHAEARPVWLPPTPLVTEEYRSVDPRASSRAQARHRIGGAGRGWIQRRAGEVVPGPDGGPQGADRNHPPPDGGPLRETASRRRRRGSGSRSGSGCGAGCGSGCGCGSAAAPASGSGCRHRRPRSPQRPRRRRLGLPPQRHRPGEAPRRRPRIRFPDGGGARRQGHRGVRRVGDAAEVPVRE